MQSRPSGPGDRASADRVPADRVPADRVPADRVPGDRALPDPRRSLVAGVLAGVGLAATGDEVVLHQLLHWHHLYDGGGPGPALVSDGVLHVVGTAALVAGLLAVAACQRRRSLVLRRTWAGLLLGLGGFQLYDGTVQHKLLHLHQIRYGVVLWPYDLAWNAAAVLALVAGVVVLRRPGRGGPTGVTGGAGSGSGAGSGRGGGVSGRAGDGVSGEGPGARG